MPPLTRWQRFVLHVFPSVKREIQEQNQRIERTAELGVRTLAARRLVERSAERLSSQRVEADYRSAPWPRFR